MRSGFGADIGKESHCPPPQDVYNTRVKSVSGHLDGAGKDSDCAFPSQGLALDRPHRSPTIDWLSGRDAYPDPESNAVAGTTSTRSPTARHFLWMAAAASLDTRRGIRYGSTSSLSIWTEVLPGK